MKTNETNCRRLELPDGAVLEIRKPRKSSLYLPVRVRFNNGMTTANWRDELWNLGVEVLDWEHPTITEKIDW